MEENLPTPVRGWRRWLYIGLGMFFVGLGVLGIILPVLPTTPFILLAGFFFVRSSERLNAWLLRSRLFGPMLRDWQRYRGVRRRVKVMVLILMPAVALVSILLAQLSWPWIAALSGLVLIGMFVVYRLPVIRPEATEPCPAPTHNQAPVSEPSSPTLDMAGEADLRP